MSHFEQDQFNYISHLQLDKLLDAQALASPSEEEMLFVVIHQVYELWFKQLIHDTRRVITHLEAAELPQATWLLQRMGRILQVADVQLGVLEMLTFADFQEIRPYLQQASGLQSQQFREFEVLGGLCETVGAKYTNWVNKLWPDLVESVPLTLHQAFLNVIEQSGLSLMQIYEQRWQQFELFALCEACLEVDRRMKTWRQNHIQMVSRMIGGQSQGTGGTFVEKYLEPTTKYYFFPELWAVRNEMTAVYGGKLRQGNGLSD